LGGSGRTEYPPEPTTPPKPAVEVPAEGEVLIPERFRLPVFAQGDELARYAPQGTVKKTLGEKFMPARSKKAKSTPRE